MSSHRLIAFDGLRGALAAAVVFHHYAHMARVDWFNLAWIAVDIFFVMSGFVIYRAYAGRIAAGLTLQQFTTARLRRLYPIYLSGVLLGALSFWWRDEGGSLPTWFSLVALAALLTPYFGQADGVYPTSFPEHPAFPLNDPAWSLFFEFFANFVFFQHMRRGRGAGLLPVILASGALYLWYSANHGFHAGWGQHNFAGGFARVVFYFYLGVGIHQLHQRMPRVSPFYLLVTLVVIMVLFTRHRTVLVIALLFLIGPAAVLMASLLDDSNVPDWVRNTMTASGDLSYPVYIFHYPVGLFIFGLAIPGAGPVTRAALAAAITVALAVLALGINRQWIDRSKRAPTSVADLRGGS